MNTFDIPLDYLKNIGKAPIEVKHSELTLWDPDNSPFKTECPICKDGILLVGRNQNSMHLDRIDRCIRCSQLFVYTDDSIMGEQFHSSLEEVRMRLALR